MFNLNFEISLITWSGWSFVRNFLGAIFYFGYLLKQHSFDFRFMANFNQSHLHNFLSRELADSNNVVG
uniref:Uncharacterized protein n=2 Tax=Meloidogyne TaxID=189290 RepID=A0A6V7W2K1_MELEN|nr:unnamed protein product [Meloidogyne enterolobii]